MVEEKFSAIKIVSILDERVRKKNRGNVTTERRALSFFLHVYIIKIIIIYNRRPPPPVIVSPFFTNDYIITPNYNK